MVKSVFLTVFFVAVSNIVFAEVPFIIKCNLSDNECLRQNAMANRELFGKGIPEYNVESLDPAFFKSVDASINNLKLIATDVVIRNLSKCNFKKIQYSNQINIDKSSMKLDLICSGIIDGDYEMDGHLLLLPISGKGKLHAELNQVAIKIDANIETFKGKDDKKHWRISSWTHSFELRGKNKLHFDNLFNGNKALAKAANDLLENNTNAVVEELGDPVLQAIVEKLMKNISAFYKKAPLEDLTLDN